VVDLTHGVPAFDVRAGALVLSRSVGHLGPGVVVGVVDPGVGGDRRAVAVAVDGGAGGPGGGPRYLIGPDNGLLGWAIEILGGPVAAVCLTPAAGPSRTFDGRDVFAPAAGRLWSGASLHDIGIPIDPGTLVELPRPVLEVGPGALEAEVLWVDRFGNVQLSARPADAERAGLAGVVEIGTATAAANREGRAVASFAELEGDEVGLLVDANGQLALVCDRRPAATVLGVRPGDIVTLAPVFDVS